jgi:hypothetical protein
MAHRHPFKDCNLIPDLGKLPQSALPLQISESTTPSSTSDTSFGPQFPEDAHHMFSPSHQPLVDHFSSIIPPGVNVDAFLYNGVTSRAKGLPRLVPTWLDLSLLLRRERARLAVVGCHVNDRSGQRRRKRELE